MSEYYLLSLPLSRFSRFFVKSAKKVLKHIVALHLYLADEAI